MKHFLFDLGLASGGQLRQLFWIGITDADQPFLKDSSLILPLTNFTIHSVSQRRISKKLKTRLPPNTKL